MRSLFEPGQPGILAATRIVLMPGAYDTGEDFLRAGFASAVRARRMPIDLTLLDLDLKNLTDRSALIRLRDEIVLPARALGCRRVWLLGISLGGLVALDYVLRYPADIDGVCLLAPYLGSRMLTGEIDRAQGLAAWEPGELAESDDERRRWRFLKTLHATPLLMYLGYGREDRFAPAHALLAAALPPEAVAVLPGGHDWGTWARLWENFLDAGVT